MENPNDARRKLAWAARTLAQLKSQVLQAQKDNHKDLQRPDFLWHYLLQSFATMGGVAGWQGLIGNEDNYGQVTYEAVGSLREEKRLEHVTEVCERAKVRYAKRKAEFIIGCYDKIRRIGGLEAAKAQLLTQLNRNGKIAFLKSFPGIGEKYARNIMMDVYQDDFRDAIAVDSRIKAISAKWGLEFASYVEHEEFYLSVAREAGLNGWELDRLMFRFQTVFYPPIAARNENDL